ncbi:peptidase S53 [Corallococcus praedator]|uniref:Peptidase S53 n=1 Tax=Corallococcus praedator TaxID=2316724 RepID=A0ABX9QHN1_9BACT|nr:MULTISPECIES: S53 family peptidase [Corallococcus]RKH11245.1 peptidase S53 [Corallococcus sp. CA047B]RKH28817.1 peptidase S53 [Corallococcus sp. CA031C]RKI08335.1 peptidase S53 [Corallococcus praedator]
MARIPPAQRERVFPFPVPLPLRVRALKGPVKLTLLLRPAVPLPTVEALCEEPPPRPLTHEEFEAKYGTAKKDLAAVERFAKAFHLRVVSVQRDRGFVQLEGSPTAIRKAFSVDLKGYQLGKLSFLSHTKPLAMPRPLRGVVEWVFGLDTRPLVTHSSASPPVPVTQAEDAGLRSYPAAQVARLYRYPPTQGEGQCVGIIELTGGYRQEDLTEYLSWMGVTREAPVNVGPNKPTLSVSSNAEVTMDVELVSSVCPKARVVVYNAGSKDYSLGDYHRAFAMAISDRTNRPSVLTSSWSFYEGSLIQPDEEAAFERLFKEAALLGITVCAASGDLGSQVPVKGGSPTDAITVAAPSYPAASALVLGCGGTTLEADGDRILHEQVWNRLGEAMSMGALGFTVSAGASSGGVSTMNALPPYQNGMNVPVQVNTTWKGGVFQLTSRTPGRGVPDVAANADLHTGYQIVFKGQRGVAAGTSAAAPMWAALLTLINEGLGERVGFLNPRLYTLVRQGAPVVHRITRGGNGAYFASADAVWNACTGLGTPDGEALLAGLRGLKGHEA